MRAPNKNRARGRSNRRAPNPNRSFESNGPEGKIRGNASQVYEKYSQLARDAQATGDPIAAEGFWQHAEHYYRIMSSQQPNNRPQQNGGGDYDQNGQPGMDEDRDFVEQDQPDDPRRGQRRNQGRNNNGDDNRGQQNQGNDDDDQDRSEFQDRERQDRGERQNARPGNRVGPAGARTGTVTGRQTASAAGRCLRHPRRQRTGTNPRHRTRRTCSPGRGSRTPLASNESKGRAPAAQAARGKPRCCGAGRSGIRGCG